MAARVQGSKTSVQWSDAGDEIHRMSKSIQSTKLDWLSFHNAVFFSYFLRVCWSETDYNDRRMLRLEIPGKRPGGTATRRFMEVKLVGARVVEAGGRTRWTPRIGCGPWRHQLTPVEGKDEGRNVRQISLNKKLVVCEVQLCSFAPVFKGLRKHRSDGPSKHERSDN